MIFPSLLLAIVHFSSSTLAFNLHNPTTSIIIRNSNSKNVRVASSSSPSSPSSSPTKLYISNLFKGETDRTPQLPKDVKEAVSKCRQAVQKGLENKMSRMVRPLLSKYHSPLFRMNYCFHIINNKCIINLHYTNKIRTLNSL